MVAASASEWCFDYRPNITRRRHHVVRMKCHVARELRPSAGFTDTWSGFTSADDIHERRRRTLGPWHGRISVMVPHDGGCSMAYLRANTACIFFGPRARCGRGLRGDEWLDRFVGALRRVVRPVAAPLQAPQTECGGEHQKLIDLFHISYVGLAHRPLCSPSPRIKWVSPIPQDRTSALGFIFRIIRRPYCAYNNQYMHAAMTILV